MSKSMKRVRAVLERNGAVVNVVETGLARTARDAADAVGCEIDQIAKSIVLCGQTSGEVVLFVTAGGRQVDLERAAALAGEPLGKADAAQVRAQTGFAIGGVSPVGETGPLRKWFDEALLAFPAVWAAAGTPHHMFCAEPAMLLDLSAAQVGDFSDPLEG